MNAGRLWYLRACEPKYTRQWSWTNVALHHDPSSSLPVCYIEVSFIVNDETIKQEVRETRHYCISTDTLSFAAFLLCCYLQLISYPLFCNKHFNSRHGRCLPDHSRVLRSRPAYKKFIIFLIKKAFLLITSCCSYSSNYTRQKDWEIIYVKNNALLQVLNLQTEIRQVFGLKCRPPVTWNLVVNKISQKQPF